MFSFHRENIASSKIATSWTDFVGGAFKPAVNCIKDEIKLTALILNRHKEKLAGVILDKK